MTAAREIIDRLSARGIMLQPEDTDGLLVIGISKLTDQEKAMLKAHKQAILEALRQSAEAVDDCPTETLPRALVVREVPLVMAAGGKADGYAPNCNRCAHYRWRAETCRRRGPVRFPNTPPCGGQGYQPFAPTLAEREAVAFAAREGAP